MFKKIYNKLKPKTTLDDLTRIVYRFPATSVSLLVLFGVSTIMIYIDYGNEAVEYSILIKTLVTSVFLALLSYALVLGLESWQGKSFWWSGFLYVLVVVCGVMYYLYIPDQIQAVPFEIIFTLFGIMALILVGSFAARFQREYCTDTYEDEPFYLFVLSQLLAISQGVLVALLSLILGAATLASLDTLFSLSISDEWYLQWVVVSMTLIGPVYFLSHVPEKIHVSQMQGDVFKKFLRFVIRYLALPFIGIYFAILYAYSIKVLLQFSQWPEGVVAWMVIIFSFFGFITFFFSYQVRDEQLVSIFRKWFPYVLAPQMVMLFYAIGLRIAQHGFTINRYLVVAFGVWISFLCLYYIFSRKKSLFVLPASLFVGLLIVLTGPWGMFAVSERSQVNKLQNLFTVHGIITKEGLETLSTQRLENIPRDDQDSMVSTVAYICANHGCESLKDLVGDSYNTILKDTESSYAGSSALLSYIGLPEYVRSTRGNNEKTMRSWYASHSGFTIDTRDSESVTNIQSYTEKKTPFGVTAGNRVTINFLKSGIQDQEDITKQLSEFIFDETSSFGFSSDNPPHAITFEQGVLYLVGVSAQIEDGAVMEFRNVEGFLVVTE